MESAGTQEGAPLVVWASYIHWASQVVLVVKNLPASPGDVRDAGSILGSGRSPGGGHGNPLQYSCLENPTDRGAWWTTVYRVAKSRTRLKRLSTNIRVYSMLYIYIKLEGHIIC